ncbi:MAG: MMPL family transporter [Deltaproteobacteria bacterium]|nr:MMPL family transporter [Deltaproteobacteria bacterium]
MNKYIRFVLRWPKTVIAVLLLISIILTPGIKRLEFDNSVEAFLPKDDQEYLFFNQIRNIYGDNGRFLIMAITPENLWYPETFRELDRFFTDLEEYQTFDEAREQERLRRFEALMDRPGDISRRDLMNAFADDPGFQRLLERKSATIFGRKGHFNGSDLRGLRKKIIRSCELKRSGMIDDIISPLTAQDITGRDDTLEAYYLVEKDDRGKRILPGNDRELGEFRSKLERNPAFEKGIYSRDSETGEITSFGAVIKFFNKGDRNPIACEILQIIESYPELGITPQGMEMVYIWINRYLHHDLFTFIPIVLLVVILVFFFNFRTTRGVLLPFISLAMGLFWILGLMGYLGCKITAIGVAIPVLMIAVGSSYSIHIMNQYYADFRMISQKGKIEGLRLSMTHISLTVLLAGLTTFIAFMTLVTSSLIGIRDWGFFCALGVLFAVMISSSLIPAGLALLPHSTEVALTRGGPKAGFVDRIIRLMTRGATVHYRKVMVAVAIVLCISFVGIYRLEIETTFLSYFKEHDPIRRSAKLIGDRFGGEQCLNILIDSGKADGTKDPGFLMMVEDFRGWLESEDNPDLNVGRTDAFPDYIKTMHMAMNNDRRSYFSIPVHSSDIMDYLEIYSGEDVNSDGRVDDFESYVDRDFRTTNVLARICQKQGHPIGTAEINHIASRIAEHLRGTLPPGMYHRITGHPMINVKLAYYIVMGQVLSLFLSLFVIGVIVTLLFNHIKAGLLALIPMSVAVIFNFGIMGLLGIKLDLATSIIAAVTIGIGVDDTIHFLNTFRHNREKGCSVDETIAKTLAVSGKAIIFTSLALILGFSVLVTSKFIPVILFGILMATTMIATTAGALLILPAAIKLTGVRIVMHEESESWLARSLNLGRLFGLEQEK